MGLKRGRCYALLVAIALMFLFQIPSIYAPTVGFCANPFLLDPSALCTQILQEICCPQETTPPTVAQQRYYGHLNDLQSQQECITNYFDYSDPTVGGKCQLGCCFTPAVGGCEEGSTYKTTCDAQSGIFGTTCGQIRECTRRCCAYEREGQLVNESLVTGQCEALGGKTSDPLPGGQPCTSPVPGTAPPTMAECSDGRDNDNDAVIDQQDPGCTDAAGTYNPADASEHEARLVCDDGVDNDGDLLIDYPNDGGCCRPDTSDEGLCERNFCSGNPISNAFTQSSPCACIQYTQLPTGRTYLSPGVPCTAGKYCCSGTCQETPCVATGQCNPGDQRLIRSDPNGCSVVVVCGNNGQWDNANPITQCPQPPEICDDGRDNNNNNLVDCIDPQCFNLRCNIILGQSSCGVRGYVQQATGQTLCCNQEPQDCDRDGTKETCGTCDCTREEQRQLPTITNIRRARGVPSLELLWRLNCDVQFRVWRCEGNDETCKIPSAIWSPLDPPGLQRGINRFVDESITPQTNYCYKVEAVYPTGSSLFSVRRCVSSGHAFCMEHDEPQFCMYPVGESGHASEPREGVRRTVKATCDEENNLIKELGRCDDNELCMGPFSDGTVRCVYQNLCAECGDPYGMFSIFDVSKAKESNGLPKLCKELRTCYFDLTNTIKNNFQECSQVNTCYEYRSQFACENNQCLTRACSWMAQPNSVTQGYCEEVNERYKKCEYCQANEHNKIFDACTKEKCALFNEGECFYGRDPVIKNKGQCKSKSQMTCKDYITKSDCVGDPSTNGVEYDVTYDTLRSLSGKRISGTNRIVHPSNDLLGLGKCYWNDRPELSTDIPCFKDGNGDRCEDGNNACAQNDDGIDGRAQLDMIPPQTTLMPPYKVRMINMTVIVTDPVAPDTYSSGPWYTFLCIGDDNPECYPQKEDSLPTGPEDSRTVYHRQLGLGQGKHLFRMYSIDWALNIEEIKEFTLDVDRKPPTINITWHPLGQTRTTTNSTFTIETDENAYCKDALEGQLGSHIPPYFGTIFQTSPPYANLVDGTYFYKVNCTDVLNNTGTAYKRIHLDADHELFDPQPFGVVDRLPVVLSISTLNNLGQRCKFGVQQPGRTPTYTALQNYFDGPVPYTLNDVQYYSYTKEYTAISSDGVYAFDVLCDLGTRQAYDEIQFVYDTAPPRTMILDVSGNLFNITGFYNNLDQEIYLNCLDTPELGFGCNVTYYCITDAQRCDPLRGTMNDPFAPLRINITTDPGKTLCYQSRENVFGTYDIQGGKYEPIQCHTLHEDLQAPEIIVIYPDTSQTPAFIAENPIAVTGEVRDPDADGSGGQPHNILRMSVSREDTGQTLNYTIDANPFFEQQIVLGRADTITQVSMTAVDRSQAIATKTFDIKLVEYNDTLIQLVNPPGYYIDGALQGIAPNRTFDLVLRTQYPSTCKISYVNQAFAHMPLSLTPVGDSREHLIEQFRLSTDLPRHPLQIFAGCKRTSSGFAEDIDYRQFFLSWDSQLPEITLLELDNSDAKTTPTIVEPLLETNLLVLTNVPTRCKYAVNRDEEFIHMGFFPTEETQLQVNHSLPLTDTLQDFAHYRYFVQCESGSGLRSEKKQLAFEVNSSKFSGLELHYPARYISETSFIFDLATSKTSTSCYYGANEESMNQSLTPDGIKKRHSSGMITLPAGNYEYHFKCIFAAEGWVHDYFNFTIDTTPPVLIKIDDGNHSFSTTTLSATWEFYDNESVVDAYNYSVGSMPAISDVANWTVTPSTSATLINLNLTDMQTYYWNVQAHNRAALWSTVYPSDGIPVDTTRTPNETRPEPQLPCENNVKDGDESDVDCGGQCDVCGYGKRCTADTDCFSIHCVDNICQEATCDDLLKNGHESDVDCGGQCAPCGVDKTCEHNDDNCATKYCKDNLCQESSCSDGERNGLEEGVDCGGQCERQCFVERLPSCTDGIQNQNETGIDCGGVCSKKCESAKPETTPWWTYVLVALAIIAVGGGGYYFYTYYYQRHLPPEERPLVQRKGQPILQQLQKRSQQPQPTSPKQVKTQEQQREATPEELAYLLRQNVADKKKERESLFKSFEEGEEPTQEEEPKAGEKLKLKEFDIEGKIEKRKK